MKYSGVQVSICSSVARICASSKRSSSFASQSSREALLLAFWVGLPALRAVRDLTELFGKQKLRMGFTCAAISTDQILA